MNLGPYQVPGHYTGDALECLRALPNDSIHCCVTSPPYWGLRDYGCDGQIGLEETPDSYVARMVEVFAEVRRVLRADGTCWLNLGDSYATKPHGPNGANPGENAQAHAKWRIANAIRPNNPIPVGLKHKDLVMIPARVALALQADGWWLRSDIIWAKPNPMPESVTDRPTSAHEHVFLMTKSARYYYDADAVREAPVYAEAGTTRGGERERNVGGRTDGFTTLKVPGGIGCPNPAGRNQRNVWTIATAPYKGSHYAVYPPEIPKRCIMAGCPADGIVLDPFHGSGCTGMVAEDLGRHWLGFDLDPRNEQLVEDRTRQIGLFTGASK